MTDEKIVEIWDKAYTSSKPVRETLLDIYEKGREDGRVEAIDEYKRKLKEDVIARAKSVSVTMLEDEQKAFNYATETFISALDYFAKQLKEK